LDLAVDQSGNQTRIGARLDAAASRLELRADIAAVLDAAAGAVRDAARAVRMRVRLRRLAARGPARVAEPELAAQLLAAQLRVEVRELAHRAPDHQLAAVPHRDARGVVAAVLEAAQAVDQHLLHASRATDVADDSAHALA